MPCGEQPSLYRNTRYNAEYAIDRQGVAALLHGGRIPVRMVAEVRPEYNTEWAAMKAVASKLGIGSTETLREWVRQDQID